jgi:4-hydroxybenzoate polyprenyltransferase/phosphoserine phosphatase
MGTLTERQIENTVPQVCAQSPSMMPLVVDLDGTLTPTDTLIESTIQVIKRNPVDALRLPMVLSQGRAAFKHFISSKARLSAENLPYRSVLLDYLKGEKEKGRRLILATAANRRIADAVASHLGLFDMVLASDERRNLKGTNKLQAIHEAVGCRFAYAGDSRADLPVWKAADAAILMGASASLTKVVRSVTNIERQFPREGIPIATWLRALRIHQWLKNLLLFIPLLTAFSFFEYDKLATVLVAFLAFSMSASATYIANDLLDIESDRAHPRKRHRAFASAQIPVLRGVIVGFGALCLALGLASSVSEGFLLMLVLYLLLTSAYSWALKEYVLIDVLMLSVLYTIRILAGSVAIGVTTSSWLLAFSVFIFLSLALVKRCSELVSLSQLGRLATHGRDYRVTDLAILWPLGVGSALCSVVVFGLFVSAPETQARYASPQLLWLVAILLIYWLSRLWIKTARGEMDDDPMVYSIRNFGSFVTILAMIVTTLIAHAIRLGH